MPDMKKIEKNYSILYQAGFFNCKLTPGGSDSPSGFLFFNRGHRVTIESLSRFKENLTSLAIYYFIKEHFKNSTIYNHNPYNTSKKLNTTRYITEKYIKIGIEEKIFIEHHGNLTAVGWNNIKLYNQKRNRHTYLTINKNDNIKKIEDKLRSLLLCDKLTQQKYRINQRTEIDNALDQVVSLKEYKRIKKLIAHPGENEKFGNNKDKMNMGYKKISKITGISIGGCQKFLDKCRKLGFITGYYSIKTMRPDLHPEYLEYNQGNNGNYYYYSYVNSCMVSVSPTIIQGIGIDSISTFKNLKSYEIWNNR
jgi:hypothetical protein